jgi:hypothetical protein
MRISNPYVRMGLAFLATVVVGGWLWFDWDARLEGFTGYLDRRAAQTSGILAGAEWKAMRAAGDLAPAADGGDGCTTEGCKAAQALAGGLWRGAGACTEGDRYRFLDGAVEITSHRGGSASGVVRRGYRVVSAPVVLRLVRDGKGEPFERSIAKLPGDIEVFTIGRSSYVRRIFRAADGDTLRLVLVEQRARQPGPAHAMYIDGKSTSGAGPDVSYMRCP